MKATLRSSIIALMLTLGAGTSSASIFFSVVGGQEIFQGVVGSSPAATNSLVLFVADTSGNGFSNLTTGDSIGVNSIFGGDDMVVHQFALADNGTLYGTATLSLAGNWTAGDPLAIYWIPSLTTGASTIGASVLYGTYTDPNTAGTSVPWITPVDGSNLNSMFFSTVNDIFGEINAAPGTGFATLSTGAIPEPSTYALIAGALALGVIAIRRRR